MSIEPIIHRCECETCKTGIDVEIMQSHQRINLFLSRLNEPQKRWYVATRSEESDGPSDRQLAIITGLDEKTIRRGKAERLWCINQKVGAICPSGLSGYATLQL